MNAESNEALPVSEKYMLTIKEAAAYFNIGIKKLRRIAENIGYAIHHRNHKDGCRNKSIADYRRCGTDVSGNYRGQKCTESGENP